MVDVRRTPGQRMSDKVVLDALLTAPRGGNPTAQQPAIRSSESTPPFPVVERITEQSRQFETFLRHAIAATLAGDGSGNGGTLAAGIGATFRATFEPTLWLVRCINNGTNAIIITPGQSVTLPAILWDKDTYVTIPGVTAFLSVQALAANGAAIAVQAVAISGLPTSIHKEVPNGRYEW